MSNPTSVTVDWLSYTLKWGSKYLPVSFKHRSLVVLAENVSGHIGQWMQGKGFKGYTVGIHSLDVDGLSVFMHPSRPDMGIHVSYSGRALARMAIPDLLRFVHEAGGSVTRLDIAVDVFHQWDIRELKRAADAKEWDCKVKKKPVLLDGEGLTLYIGSRTSEKFLRIYDKAAESGTPFAWTRIELECKAEFARGVFGHLVMNGWDRIPNLIRGFCDFNKNAAWRKEMMNTHPALSIPKAERHSDTDTWLLTSVMPSLVKRLNESEEFRLRWGAAFRLHVEAFTGVGEGDRDIFDGKGDFELQ